MIPHSSPGTSRRRLSLPRATRRSDASMPVASSAISHLDYDPATQELTVTFASGHRYTISDFPEIEAHRWSTAASPGKYFNENIRGRY